MFRMDKTTQVIKCILWSTRLHPYSSLIQKMSTYLELKGKFGPKPRPQPQSQSQPSTSTPPQNNNPMTRKAPGPQMNEKKRRTRVPTKRWYKSNCPAIPSTPTPTALVNLTPIVPTPTDTSESVHSFMIKLMIKDDDEDPSLIWTILAPPGSYIGTIGMTFTVCIGVYCF